MGVEDHKGYIPAGVETSMSGYSSMYGDPGAGSVSPKEHEAAMAVIREYYGAVEKGDIDSQEIDEYLRHLLLIGGFGKGRMK